MPLRHFVQFAVIWKAEINPEGHVPLLFFFLSSCMHFTGSRKALTPMKHTGLAVLER